MRTYCVIILILVFLVGISLCESLLINRFCSDIEYQADIMCEKVKNDEFSFDTYNKIKRIWENNKMKIYVFKNHNAFYECENIISDMSFFLKKEDKEELYYTAYKLSDTIKNLRDGGNFNIGNIF